VFGISKRAIAIIFGILIVVFAVGAVLLFTPIGQQQNVQGPPQIVINGQPVSELDVLRFEQSDPILSSNPQGALKAMAETNFVESLIQYYGLLQASRGISVSGSQISQALNALKQQAGITTSQQYNQFLNQQGLTDFELRQLLRSELQIQGKISQIEAQAKPTTAQLELYYELHKSNYQGQAQVLAREIVVDQASLAQNLYQQLLHGARFSQLAQRYSKVGAAQGGALGAKAGQSTPQPVTAIVFPAPVAKAVFALTKGGITPPIAAGGQYYIVKVERYLPPTTPPFDQVKSQVEADVQPLAGQEALENYLAEIRHTAKVTFPKGSILHLVNPVVAQVNGTPITLAAVARNTFGQPQIATLIQRGLGAFVQDLFVPQVLDSLIDQDVVLQEAHRLGLALVGTKAQQVAEAEAWAARNVQATPAQVRQYYLSHLQQFTLPAQAQVTGISFKTLAEAQAFLKAASKGGALNKLAKTYKGTLTNYGTVDAGGLPTSLNTAVFDAHLSSTPLGALTAPVKMSDGTYEVALVQHLTPSRVQSFSQVEAQAATQALQQAQLQVGQQWVASLRAKAKIQNLLSQVLAQLAPKTSAPSSQKTPSKPAPKSTPSSKGTTSSGSSSSTSGSSSGK
jgi:parvulin-like peptidyl-prolyl isomerase